MVAMPHLHNFRAVAACCTIGGEREIFVHKIAIISVNFIFIGP
jgi:hypothetical protein